MKDLKKININSLIILIFLIFDVRFFYMINLPKYFGGDGTNKMLLSLFGICVFIYYVIRHKFAAGEFGVYILGLYIILAAVSISSLIKLDYKITQVVWPLFPFINLLYYFILREILNNKRNFRFFLRMAETIWSILVLLFLAQRFMYLRSQTIFMKLGVMLPEYYFRHPELGFRIYNVFEGFNRIFVILTAYIVFKNHFRKCKFEMVYTLLGLLAILLVDGSRFYIATVVLVIIIEFLLVNKERLRFGAFLLLISGLLLGAAVGFKIYKSVNNDISEDTGSSYARTGAVDYYLSEMKGTTFFFGFGIANPDEGDPLYKVIHGPDEIYHFDDIGLVGTFAKFGIFSVIWYILFLLKMIHLTINTDKKRKALSIGITVMAAVALITQSYLDPQRILAMLFSMILLEINLRSPEVISN